MNKFEEAIEKLVEESRDIQKRELMLREEAKMFNEKFMGFLRENGLPENFTLPLALNIAIKKAKSTIEVVG